MKLRGLPLDLRPGPVELQVAMADCPLLQPCMYCKFYNRMYFICRKSHVTCAECFLPDSATNKLARSQYEGYCQPCTLQVTLYRVEVPMTLLKSLTFICGCDYAGKLTDIKKHVKSDDFCMSCSLGAEESPSTSDEFDVALAKLQLQYQETITDYYSQLLIIREKFQESFGGKMDNAPPNTVVYSKKLTDSSTIHLGLLNRRLKNLRAEAMVLRKRSVKITPLVQDKFGRILEEIQTRTAEGELTGARAKR